MNAPDIPLSVLLSSQASLEELVLACAVVRSWQAGERPLLRGVSEASFTRLCREHLNDVALENGPDDSPRFDEFDELFELLSEYAEPRDEMSMWIAAAVATAAQRDNHLWQDMGLPSRRELSAILQQRFPRLAAANTGDMKWKKFFYRQLCQRAGVPICKSPNCVDCCDHALCFGPES